MTSVILTVLATLKGRGECRACTAVMGISETTLEFCLPHASLPVPLWQPLLLPASFSHSHSSTPLFFLHALPSLFLNPLAVPHRPLPKLMGSGCLVHTGLDPEPTAREPRRGWRGSCTAWTQTSCWPVDGATGSRVPRCQSIKPSPPLPSSPLRFGWIFL